MHEKITFSEMGASVTGTEEQLMEFAETLRDAEGTWGDIRYKIEHFFDVDGIRTNDEGPALHPQKPRYKVYAAQVPWSTQESPYMLDNYEYRDEIYITGNSRLMGLNGEVISAIEDALGDVYHELDIFDSGEEFSVYDNHREIVEDSFCGVNIGELPDEVIENICRIAIMYQYGKHGQQDDAVAAILSIMHGKEYTYRTIRGSSQSEWNYLYCPADMEWWRQLEAEYFNTGEEWWVMEDSETDGIDPDDIDAEYVRSAPHYSMYVYDDAQKEIAKNIGLKPEEVKLFRYRGEARTHVWDEE